MIADLGTSCSTFKGCYLLPLNYVHLEVVYVTRVLPNFVFFSNFAVKNVLFHLSLYEPFKLISFLYTGLHSFSLSFLLSQTTCFHLWLAFFIIWRIWAITKLGVCPILISFLFSHLVDIIILSNRLVFWCKCVFCCTLILPNVSQCHLHFWLTHLKHWIFWSASLCSTKRYHWVLITIL